MRIVLNQKKKILFVIPGFHIGGTTISLNNMLSLVDTTRYEIDLFALVASGTYKEKMKNCTILQDNLFYSSIIKSKTPLRLIAFFLLSAARKVLKLIGFDGDVMFWKIGNREFAKNNYDVVVSFQEGGLTKMVSYIPSKKHIAWVHCDYSRYLSLLDNPNELPFYKKYDSVVCVSDYSKKIMQNCLPEIKNKIISIHNVIDYTKIRKSARNTEDIDPRFDTNMFTIVSVGRIDSVKQFEKIPALVAKIKKSGIPFKWYLIGGRGNKTITNKIIENTKNEEVEGEFIWLGEKTNIYAYMAKAKLLVNTSLSESFPLVINEAKVLGIPVLANNFSSAYESVEEGKSGFVLPVEDMAEKIIELINNQSLLEEIKEYLSLYKYDNETIMQQIYELFES